MKRRLPRLLLCMLALTLGLGPWAHGHAQAPARHPAPHCMQHGPTGSPAAPVAPAPGADCCQPGEGGCGCVHAGLMLTAPFARVSVARAAAVTTAGAARAPVSQATGLFRPPI